MRCEEKIRAAAEKLLRTRLDRINRLVADGAPPFMIAGDLELLGDLARFIDPDGTAARRRTRDDIDARRMAGLCIVAVCDEDAISDGTLRGQHCVGHAALSDFDLSTAFSRPGEES